MKNRKINLSLFFLFLYVLSCLLSFKLGRSVYVSNGILLLKIIGIVGLFISFGYDYFSGENRFNKFFKKMIIPFYICLIIFSLLSFIKIDISDYIKKSFMMFGFLSPFFKSTYSLLGEVFYFPTMIIILYSLFYIYEKMFDIKNNRNLIILCSFLGLVSIGYGLFSYSTGYVALENGFYNIFNIFSLSCIFSLGVLAKRIDLAKKLNINIIKTFIIGIVIVGVLSLLIIKEDFLLFRITIYYLPLLLALFISLFYSKYHNKDEKYNIFSLLIICPYIIYFLFNMISIKNRYRSLISVVLIGIVLFIIPKIKFNKKIKLNDSILKKVAILFLVGTVLFHFGLEMPTFIKEVGYIKDNKIKDVNKYLYPLVDNIEKNIKQDKIYSYMYIDEPDIKGYLSYNRLRYLLDPNEMIKFNDTTVIFYHRTEEEILEYLNETKVDYIFVRRSARIEELLGVKIPKEGLIYKKNNEIVYDIKDSFIPIEEVD